MDISPSISGKMPPFFAIPMKHVVLFAAILCTSTLSFLHAGTVVTLADAPEVTGTLTLTPTTIKVTNSSPAEINLSDVLEADFSNTPFHLDYYLSNNDKGGQLPPNWTGQDIGELENPGSVVDANGTLTVKGSGNEATKEKKEHRESDALYFAGQPWTGDGEWTARLASFNATGGSARTGLMLRDSLDPTSIMFSLSAGISQNGWCNFRTETGKPFQGISVPMDIPIWLRLTRYGDTVFGATSADGKAWDSVALANFKPMVNPWIGFFVDTHKDKDLNEAVFDQVSFTPVPSSAQVLPPGVILQSGTFLAGSFEHLSFDPATPEAQGSFRRNGKTVNIPRSKIAAIIMLPMPRSQIAEMSSHIGLLMKNGDVMDGDFDSINGNSVLVNSVLLGITTYSRSDVRGCFLQPLQAPTGLYTIRLHDGSIINTAGLGATNGDTSIQEASGIVVNIDTDEVTQFRAGPSQIQSLAELAWKATPPSTAAPATNAPGPVVSNSPSTNAAPANAMPAANAAPVEPPPAVRSWAGPNQEQVMEASIGTSIDFPLTGKFRAMGVRIALSADSPPNSQVTIRVLADGREAGRTPPFKAGDQPRFLELTLQDPKTVTLEADSIFAGPIKVLFIDPIGIRDN